MAPWVKLDDCFSEHPKVEQAGDLAAWLYVCGLQYCSRALSDGFIPEGRVSRLTGLQKPHKLAARLVEVGLWERVEGGFQVHDYSEHQRTAEQIKRERQRTAERVTRHRSQRPSNAVGNGLRNGVTNADVTLPDTDTDTENPPNPPAGGSPEFEEARTIRDLFTYWQQRCNHGTAKLTDDRRGKIRARLREGYTTADIRLAIDGASTAAFVDDQGKRHDDLTLICRNGSKLEDFMDRGRRAGPTATGTRESIDEERERKLREQLV